MTSDPVMEAAECKPHFMTEHAGRPSDPYPRDRYRCMDCEDHECTGKAGLTAHRQWHRERGDGPPRWEVIGDGEGDTPS